MKSTKWMSVLFVFATLAFGLATGCPDDTCTGGPCACDDICDGGDADADADHGADADADSDADSDAETEDSAADASCPSVAGNWNITYMPVGVTYTIHLEQDGCSLTGEREGSTYAGAINEDGSLSLTHEGAIIEYLTGNLVSPGHMAGNWSRDTGESGTWDAVLP